jgi:hypothetical protein
METKNYKSCFAGLIDFFKKIIKMNPFYDPDCVDEKQSIDTQPAVKRRFYANNKSGYRGVFWDKVSHKWRASITINKKTINLGRYATKLEAAKAYDSYVINNNLERNINGVL